MASSNPVIDALLNCSVCLERFKRPKLLKCGHSFCLECLEQIDGKEALSVTCPLCKAGTFSTDGLSSLTDDFRVNQIQEGLEAMARRKEEDTERKCDICSAKEPEVTCLQCHKAMCDGCLLKHKKRAGTAMHTLIKTCDEKRCLPHNDLCSHVCLECRLHVCTTCLFDQCCEHDTLEIGEAARKYADERIRSASGSDSPILLAENPNTGCLRSFVFNLLPILIDKPRSASCVSTPTPAQGASGKNSEIQLKKPVFVATEKGSAAKSGLVSVPKITRLPQCKPVRTYAQQPADNGPRSVSVNRDAYIDIQAVLRGKPFFRFSRVVLDQGSGYLALVARYRYMILRYNIKSPADEGRQHIEIFMDGLTRGFDEQEDILCDNEMLFHLRGWQQYLQELRALVRDYHIYHRWILVENYSDTSHETKDIVPRAIPFQLDKVVHHKRSSKRIIIAKCGKHIIRCDYNSKEDTSKDRINIYTRQSRFYEDQEDLLDDFPDFFCGDLPEWENNILELRAMIKKYKHFLADSRSRRPSPPRRQHHGELKFERIVHYRRHGCNALIAEYHDVIVRNDYTDASNDIDIFHYCEGSPFDQEQDLLDKYFNILNSNWFGKYLDVVRPMVRELKEHMRECDHSCSCRHN